MGRHALVTGASSGIGRAVALALAGAGYRVTATGRDRAALAHLSQASLSRGTGIETLPLDLDAPDTLAARLDGLSPDILVCNAATMPPPGPFDALTPAQIAQAVTVNLTAALLLTRHLLPAMRRRGDGHLVFVSSTAAHAPAPGAALYGATKAALGSFAQSLRAELAPDGIRVTEIVPGRVETALYRDVLGDQARANLYAGAPVVQPDDIAAMLLAVLALPRTTNVSRFDILPTYPVPPLQP